MQYVLDQSRLREACKAMHELLGLSGRGSRIASLVRSTDNLKSSIGPLSTN